MWLSKGRVGTLASAMIQGLKQAGLVETEAPLEAQRDLESVLDQYVRDEQEVSQKARDLAAARNLPTTEQARIRGELAQQRGIRVGEEAIDYLLEQLVAMLDQSSHIEEIFAEDHELKRILRAPMRDEVKRYEQQEEQVQKRMKHVGEEGTRWDVEYQRIREEVSRRRDG
jgi:uncharacterized protein